MCLRLDVLLDVIQHRSLLRRPSDASVTAASSIVRLKLYGHFRMLIVMHITISKHSSNEYHPE